MSLSNKPALMLTLVMAAAIAGCSPGESETAADKAVTGSQPASAADTQKAEVAQSQKLPDIAGAPRQPFGLGGSSEVIQHFPTPPAFAQVDQLGVFVGTYGGKSDGKLILRICQAARCSVGGIELASAADNAFAVVSLESPFTINANEELTISVSTRGASRPVALWAYDVPAGVNTSVELIQKAGASEPQANTTFMFKLN